MSKNIQKLIDAIQNNDTNQIKNLVSNQGYNINGKDKDGTPIIFYIFEEFTYKLRYDVAVTLLELDADVNVRNSENIALTNLVVEKGNIDLAKMILPKSNQINEIDGSGKYPINLAIENRDKHMVELLVKDFKADLKVKDQDGNSLFFTAQNCSGPMYDMAMLLVDLGIDVNEKNNDGELPLNIAITAESADLVRNLLEHKASTDIFNSKGYLPLHQAVIENQEDLVKILVQEYKADVNAVNKNGHTALFLVTGNLYYTDFNYNMMKLLITELGADVNIGNAEGDTPLSEMIKQEKLEFVNLILDHGGKLDVHNSEHELPIQAAINGENIEIVKSILDHKSPCNGFTSENSEIQKLLDDYAHNLSGANSDISQDQ